MSSATIETDDDIFHYILENKIYADDNFIEKIYKLESKITSKINDDNLSDITDNYRNFSHNLDWINSKYKELVVEYVTDSLINDNLFTFYKKN